MAHSPDSFIFKTDRPWPNARLKVAAMVGHATSESVRLWVRTGQPGEFSLFLYPRDAVVPPSDGEAAEKALQAALGTVPLTLRAARRRLPRIRCEDFTIADYATDTTFVLDIENLDPDTRYGYALYDREGERIALGHNRLRWFRTPPSESEQRPFQFALFSCHMPYDVNGLFEKRTDVKNLNMWDFLNTTLRRHADEVDLIIAGGDQCYSDGVATLDIWRHLNRRMRKEGRRLLPDEEAMLSWYRDIYRGYWGFESVQRVFDSFPTYMIWDDHEIVDGWGSYYFRQEGKSDGLHRLLPDFEERGLTYDEGRRLMRRMVRAAKRAYTEYEHSHNPPTAPGGFDYAFRRGGCAFYVLDGRGHRDIERKSYRTLGKKQFDRFANWAQTLTPEETPFLFVVSAVPMLHTRASLVNADEQWLIAQPGLDDDLRDSWEHDLHTAERAAIMKVLFSAAAKGIRVAILSGDVHVSAVFALKDQSENRIYQLTSSSITYHVTRPQSWVLRLGAADNGETAEGYRFERLALYTDSSYALISVDPPKGEAWFKLYGEQKLEVPPERMNTPALRRWQRRQRRLETPPEETDISSIPMSHSLAKIRLF